ncbi:MAG: GAF domain-containing protein [Anaerolineae bacterium]|nr:GAF domain-containing protein [Anaerolineae bacterium]MDW8173627.1 GAF domain-containing protein [Anaerolineae bacterium]
MTRRVIWAWSQGLFVNFRSTSQLKIWSGIVSVIIAVGLSTQTVGALNGQQLFALLIVSILNTLATVLAGSLRGGLWTGYLLLSTTVAWMMSGVGAALWVVIAGASLGCAIRMRLGMWMSLISPLQEISGRISMGSAGVLASWGTWTLLGGATPVVHLQDGEAIARSFLAVVAGWLLTNVLGKWLTGMSWRRRFVQIRDNLALDALLQVVGLFMSTILNQVGVEAFTLLMGLPAAQVIRSHQLQRTRRVLMQRFSEMTILNNRSHEVMFNPNRDEALRAACEIARDITQARYVAIFVADSNLQQQTLNLSQIVGTRDQTVTLEALPLLDQRSSDKMRTISPLSQSSLAQHAQALGVDWLFQINLTFGGLVSGVLALYHPEPLHLNSQTIKLLEMLANQLVAALDNQTLLTTLEVFASEQAQLVQLARMTANTLDMSEMLAGTCDVVKQLIPTRRVVIILRAAQAAYSTASDPNSPLKIVERPCDFSRVSEFAQLGDGSPLLHRLAMSPAVSAELRVWDEAADWLLIAPLTVNRQLIGALVTYHEADYSPSDSDVRLMEMALYQIAAQLYNVQLYTETQRASAQRLRQLSLLEDIACQIAQSLEVERVLTSVLDAALQATDSELAAIGLIEGDDLLVTIKEVLPDGERQVRRLRFERMSGVMGQVAQSGETILSGDNSTLSAYIATGRQDLRSSLVLPLQVVARTIGVLNVESVKANYFNAEHLGFMRSLAGHAAITINNAKLVTAFQRSVERMEAILGAVKDGIVLLDENGLLQSVNVAAETLLGLPLLTKLSLPLDELLCQTLAERDERHKLCELVAAERFGKPIDISFDLKAETRHLQATLLPVAVVNDGASSGKLLVLRDISQEKRLAQERQLVQKAIVHDLLNPLQVIIYSFGILESDDRIPMDETNVYAFMCGMDAIQRLKRMASTILDVEKGIEAHRVRVQLDEIVQEAISLTRIIVEDQNNHVDYVADGVYILEADVDLMTRTLVNLISNANKFLPKDCEGFIRISTTHQPDTNEVVIRVSDTGPGIPDDMREEIFKEYRQLEARGVQARSGWGIGLTFCRMAVEAHQGSIWAEPNGTVLSGACFAIRLPILQYLPLTQSESNAHE